LDFRKRFTDSLFDAIPLVAVFLRMTLANLALAQGPFKLRLVPVLNRSLYTP
jgi:hypothetical protein